jgi:cold shock CspA family protein
LENTLATASRFERLSREVEDRIRQQLSPNSPYAKDPGFSLTALGFVDATRRPLPRLTDLWKIEERSTSSGVCVAAEPSECIIGHVTSILENGFGFARSDAGEDFFLHATAFEEPDVFNSVSIGDTVSFRVGERNIPGKARPAKNIRLVRNVSGSYTRPGTSQDSCYGQ